jgi:hypothetical protein
MKRRNFPTTSCGRWQNSIPTCMRDDWTGLPKKHSRSKVRFHSPGVSATVSHEPTSCQELDETAAGLNVGCAGMCWVRARLPCRSIRLKLKHTHGRIDAMEWKHKPKMCTAETDYLIAWLGTFRVTVSHAGSRFFIIFCIIAYPWNLGRDTSDLIACLFASCNAFTSSSYRDVHNDTSSSSPSRGRCWRIGWHVRRDLDYMLEDRLTIDDSSSSTCRLTSLRHTIVGSRTWILLNSADFTQIGTPCRRSICQMTGTASSIWWPPATDHRRVVVRVIGETGRPTSIDRCRVYCISSSYLSMSNSPICLPVRIKFHVRFEHLDGKISTSHEMQLTWPGQHLIIWLSS